MSDVSEMDVYIHVYFTNYTNAMHIYADIITSAFNPEDFLHIFLSLDEP